MKIRLLAHTPHPERVIASAGRLCYAPIGADELFEELSDEEVAKLVGFLIKSGHLSAIEHASFTFAIEGISRACSHQLVRHRVASYSQQSQRYVDFGEGDSFIVPPEIAADEEALEAFQEAMRAARTAYNKLVALGTAKGLGREKVQEDARFVLPNAAETKLTVTMNARSLLNFFSVRCCSRAQWEIRALADEMLGQVRGLAPTIFAAAGPGCLRGPCPEGRFSCGKPRRKTVRE